MASLPHVARRGLPFRPDKAAAAVGNGVPDRARSDGPLSAAPGAASRLYGCLHRMGSAFRAWILGNDVPGADRRDRRAASVPVRRAGGERAVARLPPHHLWPWNPWPRRILGIGGLA